MIYKKKHNNNTIRFRRFTRRAYAVFISLHREITIGTLKGLSIDAQLRKTNNTTANKFENYITKEDSFDKKEETNQNQIFQELIELIIINHSDTKVAACSALYVIKSNSQRSNNFRIIAPFCV